MGLRDSIITALTTDTTLMALLTGGVHGALEISRQNTPAAFDTNLEIKPCALVKVNADTATGPYATSAASTLEIYFYQRAGYDTIGAAQIRAMALLNRMKVGDHVWQIRWSDNVPEADDNVLNCSLGLSRYHVYRMLLC
jgi:hypothetical protein